MKKEYKILLSGILAIAIVDIVGSITSRYYGFNYAILMPVSFIIYATPGYIMAKTYKRNRAVLICAAIGLFDSTIGWKISMMLKANTGNIKNDPSIPAWIITIIFVTCFAAFCGLIGAVVARMIHKRKQVVQ
ncbi:MAG: hypothetical protein V4560_11250 [Bacteroidota bacterium]